MGDIEVHIASISVDAVQVNERETLEPRPRLVNDASMAVVSLHVHNSQFPDQVRADLINSLRSRRVNHKFHYDSIRQANKWLDLHEQYSPARTDPACFSMYDTSYSAALQNIGANPVCIIGLGCGGGQKEAQLAMRLKEQGRQVHFVAMDVSSALVITAHQRMSAIIGKESCTGLVCDLGTAGDLGNVIDSIVPRGFERLATFFGMIPNFEPQEIVPKLASVLHSGDFLLFSANLAPGTDYRAGVERVFHLYNNEPTADWLMIFLRDLGVEKSDGSLEFSIVPVGSLFQIAVDFRFELDLELKVEGERFRFQPGDRIRLFFSYRHTPATIRAILPRSGMTVLQDWSTPSEEEGVFLCRKSSDA